MKRETITRIICTVLAALLIYGSVPKAYAEEEKTYAFDAVSVEADLESIEGFSYLLYPYDPIGFHSPQIFNVAEWAYSFDEARRGDYALYVYFYNPQGLDIHEDSNQNKIVLAVDYDKYPVTQDSLPTSYETFDLAFCSKTGGDYANLFYKYRVIDHESADGKTVAERVNSNGRRYDISEILLKTRGEDNATAYRVGGTYYFTGYAAGYGADENAASTLTCDVVDLETVELEVNSTFYRTGEYERNHQHQLSSVYFAVPNEFFEKYGNLQKIKAEWYEYVTTPIVITSNTTVYDKMKPWLGKNIGFSSNDMPLSLYTGFQEISTSGGHRYSYDWVYNAIGSSPEYVGTNATKISWLFSTQGKEISEYRLTADRLSEYIDTYESDNNETYPIRNGSVSADLFERGLLNWEREHVAYVGDDIHHKLVEFDANQTFDMLNYDESNSGWQKFFNFLFGLAPSQIDESYKGISPIKIVDESDMNSANIANALLIDNEDAALKKFEDFYKTSTENNKKVVLFRFAQTDYMRLPVIAYDNSTGTKLSTDYGRDTYVVSESMFFDFTVISLTFNKDGVYRVIPAVNSPIDVIADITLPADNSFWLWWDSVKDWLSGLLEKLGAWGVLILSVVIGTLILILELKLLSAFGEIKNNAARAIFVILFLALFAFLDYMAVNFVIETINGLGGLV